MGCPAENFTVKKKTVLAIHLYASSDTIASRSHILIVITPLLA